MTIVFQVGSVNISGGTYVIFEHATRIKKLGHDVYILTEEKVIENDIKWHTDAHVLKYITYEEIENYKFDIAISTWWKTVFLLHLVTADRYIYFVQSIESKFYPESEKALRQLVESTYTLNLPIVTEATWIKEYLEEYYFSNVQLVHNGIRKDLYSKSVKSIEPKLKNGLRVLVEGPLGIPFKNVEKTIELCSKSDANEVWLLTSSPISKYENIDKVFSQVPINKVASIYRSCDVVVKLSYVEGMFGPPLEMFHCGGTAIVYDVTGHDEYIVDNVNAFVIKCDDEESVIEAINKLSIDKDLLTKLKKNAAKTADAWIDWDTSTKLFLKSLEDVMQSDNKINRKILGMLTKFHEQSYVIAETSVKRKVLYEKIRLFKIKIRDKFPDVYLLTKRVYYKIFKQPFKRY